MREFKDLKIAVCIIRWGENGKNEERENIKLNSTSGRVTWVVTL